MLRGGYTICKEPTPSQLRTEEQEVVTEWCDVYKLGSQVVEKFGGASRDRTDDLIVANDALSQLSYSPTFRGNRMISAAILSAFPAADQPLDCSERNLTPRK